MEDLNNSGPGMHAACRDYSSLLVDVSDFPEGDAAMKAVSEGTFGTGQIKTCRHDTESPRALVHTSGRYFAPRASYKASRCLQQAA